MKKLILLVVLILTITACNKEKPKAPISFDKVDLTIVDQWGRIYGLQMDSIGNTKVSVGGKFAKPMKKEFLINELILDSISKVANRVDIAKIDTGYNDSCKICVGYKIQLCKRGKSISTHVKSINTNAEIANLDKLADLLYNVVRTSDSNLENVIRKEKK